MDRKKIRNKKKKFSEHDPSKYIILDPTIKEAKNSTAVISFGRFNPITSGHEKLVNEVISQAIRRKATPMIFMSHSQDKKKNPLTYEEKIKYAVKAFGKVVTKSKARTIIEVAKQLSGKFENLVVVVGQDRIAEFNRLLNAYNGKEYNFQNIEIVSAGKRDPDSDNVEGMSASKMRSFALEGDFEEFQKGLPKKLKPMSKEIYNKVRAGMNIVEDMNEEIQELEERGPLTLAQRRRRGRVMKKYKSKIAAARKRAKRRKANPEKLKQRAQRKALGIIRNRLAKNKKYSEMSASEKIALDKRLARIPQQVINRIAKRELPKVRKAEIRKFSSSTKNEDINEAFTNFFAEAEDPDVKHLPGSQPKNYYKGVKKDVKDDRAKHFMKHGKMDDDNPAAYKPAPGDKDAKTKPSKHTKKFKQMFGEASCADTQQRKRYHMALEKNGSVKFDKRFKFFKKNLEEDNQNIAEEIQELENMVEGYILNESSKKALKKKAEKTGISYGILKKVFDRGVAAWRTGHRPGTTPTQWGLARVNSFATKGKGTWGKADKDLAAKVRKEEFQVSTTEVKENEASERAKARIQAEKERDARKHDRMMDRAKMKDLAMKLKKEELDKSKPENREYGTDDLVKILKKDTPGEEVNETALNANIKRGNRVRFEYKTITGGSEKVEGTVVGTEQYPHQEVVNSSKGRLRVRNDSGKLYIVKHEDVELI